MPEFVTLYSYVPVTGGPLRTVIRSTLDPTFIDYNDYGHGYTSPLQPPVGSILGIICQPGTFDRYTYKVSASSPFATYTKESNSTFCGYTPPACDISLVTFVVTDETDPGANDGTVNMFAVSSFGPITYFMSPPLPDPPVTNTTGFFTGLKPGTSYYINATDTNACNIHKDFIILPFSEDYTHFKYRLQFKSANGEIQWELQLYDTKHAYLKTEYPKDITGDADPVVYKIADPNEDKFSPIVSKQLVVNLLYTGDDFTPDELTLAPEQSWLVKLLKGGELEFQGYILPDEIQNFYADAPYPISITVTDGLPSLKGNTFGNGSGGQGFGAMQIQQYGLAQWSNLVKQCLDQLGYDYGNTQVISSLQYNSAYDHQLWAEIGTWSDILYDDSGVAMDTYSALALLLTGLKLTIFQHKGSFYLINWNDLAYINNGVVTGTYNNIFYLFSSDMSTILTSGPFIDAKPVKPTFEIIGFDTPMQPVNPMQTINYDKPYNIENDCSFNILALLYGNPSFEIGAVQDELPPGWTKSIDLNAFCNYDPVTDVLNSGAIDGNWELKVMGGGATKNNYIQLTDPMVNDQTNKLLNVSFSWKVPHASHTISGHPLGYVFSLGLTYKDATSGNHYYLQHQPNTALSVADFVTGSHTPPVQPTLANQWVLYNNAYASEGDIVSIKGIPTTDYTGWQSFNVIATLFPESQIGEINVQFYGVKLQLYDTALWPTGNPQYNPSIYEDVATTDPGYYLVDQLNITLSDASETYNLQTGEKHLTTAVTGIPNANLKQNDFSLFSYPANKRVAGNVFNGFDYLTSEVGNKWNFALKNDPIDRLTATITKAYARQYSKAMHKFEGDVLAPYISYYSVFGLRFYDEVLLMPFLIEGHLRTNVWHVVLVEISDDTAQNIYNYVPIYQRSARNQ